MTEVPKAGLSPGRAAVALAAIIWGGGLLHTWQRGLQPNDQPYGKLWTCAVEKESAPSKTLRLAGILRDPEDDLSPRELVVSLDGRGFFWLNLFETPPEGIFTDAATAARFRRWSLALPFPPLAPGLHTFVVSAVDTHGAMGEIGRCQFDLPKR